MKLKKAVEFFGTQTEIAKRLGLSTAAVSVWNARGGIIPLKHAFKLHKITKGRINMGFRDYE